MIDCGSVTQRRDVTLSSGGCWDRRGRVTPGWRWRSRVRRFRAGRTGVGRCRVPVGGVGSADGWQSP
jgi:hypothetical protein